LAQARERCFPDRAIRTITLTALDLLDINAIERKVRNEPPT
jgi:hypothetical protein